MIYLGIVFIVFSIFFMICAARVSSECSRVEETTEYKKEETD